jgi:hypothetical protein
MKDHTLSAVLDGSKDADSLDLNLKKYLYKILDVVDSLYALQRSDTNLQGLENYLYKEIINLLKNCTEFLPADSSLKLKAQIKSIENGIYDLAPIEIETSDKNSVYLILGKIVCPENSKKYYSAVLGIEDKSFYRLIEDYKKEISANCDNLSLISKSEISNLASLCNSFQCMNAVKLSGFVNKKHIPFSLFFSGGAKQQLSSLSNTILFTNIYIQRFKIISESLGRELIDPDNLVKQSDCNITEQILALWLWGHDIGHFLKEDNFKNNICGENKYTYEVVHELRSDIFSLYLLKQLCGQFLDIKKELVYQVFVMEMFRYIRRGGFEHQPDSVSAYLIFRFMLYKNVVSIDPVSNKIVLNYPEFGNMIDEILIAALDLFKSGLFKNVDTLLATLKIDYGFEKIEHNLELDLSFNNIAAFVKVI